jgi:hypothetical protein
MIKQNVDHEGRKRLRRLGGFHALRAGDSFEIKQEE